MLEILALCSCACVVCLWCATTLGSCSKKSKSHRKRKGFKRSSSCPANQNFPLKKYPKSCHDVSCLPNTPFICCKCNKGCRKQLRRVKTCDTTACNTLNFYKPYPVVHSCSDPGAQNAVFTRNTKSAATSYAPPPFNSSPAMCKNIGSAPPPDQCSKQSQTKMYDMSNNEKSMNFLLNSPEDISYGMSQDPIQPFFKSLNPIDDIVQESEPNPTCSTLRFPCANYYKSIRSWSPRYLKPLSNLPTTFAAPFYKLICKTCQLEKRKCICAHFWCNTIFKAGYPPFLGSNFSFPSDSPEFPTSKGTFPNCAPITLYPWSTVRFPPISDLHGTNLKIKKSRKILSTTHKRQKKSGKREKHERKR